VELGCIAEGMSDSEIIQDYPSLTKEDRKAALCYAVSVTRGEIIPINTEC